jgi:hypothetical protein
MPAAVSRRARRWSPVRSSSSSRRHRRCRLRGGLIRPRLSVGVVGWNTDSVRREFTYLLDISNRGLAAADVTR